MKNWIKSTIAGSLVTIALVACSASPTEKVDSPPPSNGVVPAAGSGCTQLVATTMFYYSDASKTQWVGFCSISCAQWVAGSATPFPGGGGTCQGTTSGYAVPVLGWCHECQL